MKSETKFYHEVKKNIRQISWIRIENLAVPGTPDLLGYNNSGKFFTVELKVTSGNKIRFSPHQIAFHVKHPLSSFILAKKPSQGSCKLFPGTCILDLVSEGYKMPAACDSQLVACGLYLSNLR